MKIPKYLEDRFLKLELDEDLDPDMGKYILYYKKGWGYPMSSYEGWNSIPVMSKKEALEFLRDAVRINEDGRIIDENIQ